MKVFVGVCSHESQHVGSIRTAYRLRTREGDAFADEWRTRGDVARERFVDHFLADDKFGPQDCILLLDGDQRHPDDMLEKLRESMEKHNLDMVCAHYYRRETKPIQSLCYEIGDGKWPFLPYLDPPTTGRHEIAVTGFGCVLIKKKVLVAVQAHLPLGMSPIAIGPLPEIDGNYMNWGPDFRFFHQARKLGFKLWLDAEVESLHGVTLWLGHKSARKLINYGEWANAAQELLEKRLEFNGVNSEAFRQRKRILEARKRGLLAQLEEVKAAGETGKMQEFSMALYIMDGRMLEMEAWIKWADKYPPIERPDQLPTTANTPAQETFEAEPKAAREAGYQHNALELVGQLPSVGGGIPPGAAGDPRPDAGKNGQSDGL